MKIEQESTGALRERSSRLSSQVLVHEMWASLAIAVMWLAVLFDALFGPDLVVSNASGTTTIPSAIIVAFLPTSLPGLLHGTASFAPETRTDDRPVWSPPDEACDVLPSRVDRSGRWD